MTPRTTQVLLALGAFVLLGQATVTGQGKYKDPDSPEVAAAAKAALANAKVLDIVGISRSVDGLLKDLGAKVVGREIRISLAADVLFDFDSAALRQGAAAQLQKVAEVVKTYPKSPVTVEGHTDSKGADAYNQALSEKRAAAVKQWLVKNGGVAAARITATGLGETTPVAPNARPDGADDPDGRQKNRRVEISLKKG